MNAETEKALLDAAWRARQNAYAPYSHFQVGAALLAEDGTIYTGVNVENSSYPAGTCAERAALASAVTAGARRFQAVAIVAGADRPCPPCGICRQALVEFSPNMTVLMADQSGRVERHQLNDLLPVRFDAEFL